MKRIPLIVAELLLILTLSGPVLAFDILDQFPSFSSKRVYTTTPLSVVFEESLAPETVDDTSFYITLLGDSDHVAGSVALDQTYSPNDTVVFTPTGRWKWGRRYLLVITADLQSTGSESFDGLLPDDGIFVANMPNDLKPANVDPLNPPAFRDLYNMGMGAIGYNPFDPEADSEPWEIPGMNLTGAFKYSTGSPDVLIAVVDTGIRTYANSDFRENIFINAGELPLPNVNGEACSEYDCNEDGRFNADDYYYDDRLGAPGTRDAMQLIDAFSDGIDDDGNGLPDDISGWDFLRETNKPLSTNQMPLGDHGYWQVMVVANQADNGIGSYVGTCPNCSVIPIRASTGIIYDFGYLAAAFRYAVNMGASVVSHAGANFTWSSQGHQEVLDGYENGTVFVGVSGDEMTFHHWMPYAGEDAFATKTIFPLPPVELFPNFETDDIAFTETFCTGYGSHVMITAPAGSECTSEAAASVGGAFGLIYSYAHELGIELEADEAKQIMMMSAYDIADRCFNIVNLSQDCQEGFDDRYGYGRLDLGKALQMLGDPDFGIDPTIPPVVHVTSPIWWQTFDPFQTPTIDVEGSIHGRQYPIYWSVQIGKGNEPLETEFIEVDAGQTNAPIDGIITTIALQNYFDEAWATRPIENSWSADVTLRVQAYYETDKGTEILGESRKTIGVRKDSDPANGLVPGFPIDIGASGESSPILYDLDGDLDGRPEILFGSGAGQIVVLKYSEASGDWESMPGFPLDVSGDHEWYRAGIFASLAVGDLFGDSTPEIVAATLDGKVYALDPMAAETGDPMLPGFPVSADPNDPTTLISFAQGNGFMSSPVLADLDLDGVLEIIVGSLDQKVYAWKPAKAPGTATRQPGWPVFCRSESGIVDEDKVCQGNSFPNVVLGTPAVGILDPNDSDPAISDYPTVLVPTDENCSGDGTVGSGRFYALYWDGENHEGGPIQPGWPATPGTILNNVPYLNNVSGIAGSPAVIVDEDETKIAVGTTMWFPQVIHYRDGAYTLEELDNSRTINAAASPTISRLEEDKPLTLLVPAIGLIQWMGDRVKIVHTMIRGFKLSNLKRKVFQADFGDIPVLLNSVVADLDADGVREVISGTGDNLVHAHKADNTQVEGWPKATQKWTWASPVVGDIDADGKIEVVSHTREGWLYAWESIGDACPDQKPNSDWRRFHHDEHNSGYYGNDTLPPARIVDLTARIDERDDIILDFTAPGDDWYCGTAERYEIRYSSDESADLSDWDTFNQATVLNLSLIPREGGSQVSLRLKDLDIDTKVFAMMSVDDVGNISRVSNAATVEPYTPDDDDDTQDDDDDDDDDNDDNDTEDDDDDLISGGDDDDDESKCGC